MADHTALLTELLPLVDERYHAALRAAIADIGRLNKVERLELDVDRRITGNWLAWTLDNGYFEGSSARAAIDGVPE